MKWHIIRCYIERIFSLRHFNTCNTETFGESVNACSWNYNMLFVLSFPIWQKHLFKDKSLPFERQIRDLFLFYITIFIFVSILEIWLVNKCIEFLCISKVKTKVTYAYLRFENDRQNGKVRKCFAFSYRQPSDIL